MNLTMMKSKIHRCTITEANLHYVGSVTIDSELMREAHILPYEKVFIVDNNNGARLETYAIPGEAGSGVICLNGAAARLVQPGDVGIIMTFCVISEEEAKKHKPIVLVMDDKNNIREKLDMEVAGTIL